MPQTRRAYKITSSTSIAAFSEYDTETHFDHVGVVNLTDGDIEMYFGQQVIPQLIVPSGTALAFDSFSFQGQAYVRNSTGIGGDVYLSVWASAVVG